jgi:DNA-directed RNA polymerase specialized sigma24 family protein
MRFPPGHRLTNRMNADESVLLHAARAGDERAFGIVLDRYRRGLEEYCSLMLGEPRTAHEAFQEIVLIAWRERELMTAAVSARMWLYRIAVRVCVETLDGSPMSCGGGDRLTEVNGHEHPY